MKVHTLNYKQVINEKIDVVFDFFSKPENLSIITPKKLNFTILTPSPIEMKDGQLIDYTVRILGKTIRWRTIITKYDPPKLFIDQQILGPYSMWHHTHKFRELKTGVEICDTIRYVMPFSIIGDIANYVWVRSDLNNIFKYRENAINDIFDYKEN